MLDVCKHIHKRRCISIDKTNVIMHKQKHRKYTRLEHEIRDEALFMSLYSWAALSFEGYSLRLHFLPCFWIDVALCVFLCVCAFFLLVECSCA